MFNIPVKQEYIKALIINHSHVQPKSKQIVQYTLSVKRNL